MLFILIPDMKILLLEVATVDKLLGGISGIKHLQCYPICGCEDYRACYPRTNESNTAPLDASHSEPVHCSMWTASKTGTEMMTSSEDGQVKWWDIRNMEDPISKIDLTGMDPAQQMSSCMMEYEPTIPSRYLIRQSKLRS